MKTKTDTIDYIIPIWAVCGLEHGDFNNLTEKQIEKLKTFILLLPEKGSFNYVLPNKTPYNDIEGFGSATIKAIYTFEVEK